MIQDKLATIPGSVIEAKIETVIQEGLLDSDLPAFIQAVLKDGGEIDAVFKREYGVLNRYTVGYRHWRKIAWGIAT